MGPSSYHTTVPDLEVGVAPSLLLSFFLIMTTIIMSMSIAMTVLGFRV